MIKIGVFDMVGTTINKNNLVYETLQSAINEIGFEVTLEPVLAKGAGKKDCRPFVPGKDAGRVYFFDSIIIMTKPVLSPVAESVLFPLQMQSNFGNLHYFFQGISQRIVHNISRDYLTEMIMSFARRQLTPLQPVTGPSGWDEQNSRWESGEPYTPILFLIFSQIKLAIQL